MSILFHNDNITQSPLDLNEYLIKRQSSTFILKVTGHSMIEANIFSGDLLIIDRSKDPVSGSIIVAILNSEFVVKEYHKRGNQIWLVARNKKNLPIEIFPDSDFLVWGVVTFIIHYAEKNNSPC